MSIDKNGCGIMKTSIGYVNGCKVYDRKIPHYSEKQVFIESFEGLTEPKSLLSCLWEKIKNFPC